MISYIGAVDQGTTSMRFSIFDKNSWIIWQLTGGPDGGAHVTGVTNASRTLLIYCEPA